MATGGQDVPVALVCCADHDAQTTLGLALRGLGLRVHAVESAEYLEEDIALVDADALVLDSRVDEPSVHGLTQRVATIASQIPTVVFGGLSGPFYSVPEVSGFALVPPVQLDEVSDVRAALRQCLGEAGLALPGSLRGIEMGGFTVQMSPEDLRELCALAKGQRQTWERLQERMHQEGRLDPSVEETLTQWGRIVMALEGAEPLHPGSASSAAHTPPL